MSISGDPQAEQVSTRALSIPFVGREAELARATLHLAPGQHLERGRTLVVQGDSGVGKTTFAREVLQRAGRADPRALHLHIDVANDEYQSARAIGSLLKLALVAGPMSGSSIVQVPEDLSFERFRRRSRQRGVGRGLLKAIAHAIGAAVGVGSAVGAALDQADPSHVPATEDELAGYLAWVARKQAVVLAIDNVQFLNLDVRLTIESVAQRVSRNLRFVVIDRTVEGESTLSPPVRCFGEALEVVQLAPLTHAETAEVVSGALGESPGTGRLADDIFSKTDGVAKDIEFCLRQYALELGRGAEVAAIEGLLSTIDRLPLLHRQFLIVAALLDGGVDQVIARNAVSRLAAIHDTTELDAVVTDLVEREYL
ncbi:hypothetical protein B7486_56620, partial [cyanobacterium TDX16]